MKTFKDNENREWTLKVDVNSVKAVRNELNINLLSFADDDFALLTLLTTDLVVLVDVLFVMCREQAKERNITDVQFGTSMSGDVIEKAADALIREIIDFFPGAPRRAMLTKVVDKGQKLAQILMDRGVKKAEILDSLDLEQEAEKMISATARQSANEHGNSAGISRELSESTPEDSRSPN